MTTLFTFGRAAIAGCLFLCISCFTACSNKVHEAGDLPLRVAVAVEISSLDPQTTTSIEAIKIQSALFETLVKVDAQTGAILPAGATDWEIADDGLTYTFHLRRNACWSTGETINAQEYLLTFQRLFDPKLAAPFTNLYFGIAGAERYHAGQTDDFSTVGVRVIDPYTLQIRLSEPLPYLLSLLARPCVAALPIDYIWQQGGTASRTTGWSFQPGFPSSGPYVLSEWIINKSIRLEQNPNYWNRGEVEIPRIFFYPMESAYTQEQGFRAGLLDVTSKLSSEKISKYLDTPVIANQPEMGTYYVILNMESPKLQTRAFRHALYRSIDRNSIAGNLRRRGEIPAYTFCPPLWGDCYPQVKPVADSTEPNDLPGERLKMLIPASETNNLIAEALQDMWQRQLGVEVQIYRQEWKSYYDSRNRGQFDLCLATWIGDYFDPLTFLEMWKTGSPNNFCRWSDPVFDDLLERSSRLVSQQERFEVLSAAEQRFMDAYPIVPVFYLSRVYLVSEDLNGWPQSILNTVDYAHIRRIRN